MKGGLHTPYFQGRLLEHNRRGKRKGVEISLETNAFSKQSRLGMIELKRSMVEILQDLSVLDFKWLLKSVLGAKGSSDFVVIKPYCHFPVHFLTFQSAWGLRLLIAWSKTFWTWIWSLEERNGALKTDLQNTVILSSLPSGPAKLELGLTRCRPGSFRTSLFFLFPLPSCQSSHFFSSLEWALLATNSLMKRQNMICLPTTSMKSMSKPWRREIKMYPMEISKQVGILKWPVVSEYKSREAQAIFI